jgi:hypothetical protein
METAYDGRQVVGMDLHRRRSVLVRMTEDGRRLGTARITNSPAEVRKAIAAAGKNPRVVLEATYGWYWAADVLQAAGAARAVWRGPGALHAGIVPALVHLGQRAAGGEGEPTAAGRAGPPRPAAAGQGRAGVHRHRLDAKRVYRHQKQGAAFGHTKIQGKSLALEEAVEYALAES